MKHLRMSWLLRIVVTVSTLFFLVNAANAQVQTPRYISTTANSGGFYEYLPAGYAISGQSYPLIVFIHGIGELGSGTPGNLEKLLNGWVALPRLISNGQFPASFTVAGQTHSFIVLSPQFKGWPSASDVNDFINYATQNYRVNTNRIYVTGLSMGGGAVWDFAGTYPNRAAAIVPIAGASWPDPGKSQAIATAKLPVWATHNDFDGVVSSGNTKGYVDQIVKDGGNAKKTIWPVGGHDAWTKTYDPNFRENGLNIYEWMLQFQKGGAPTPTPTPIPTPTPTPPPTINLPAKVEAEDYSSMNGVVTENTLDEGGGKDVGWIENGDWMDYTVNVPAAGTYAVNLRIATPNTGAQLQLKKADGSLLTTVNLSNTWGFQTWQTVAATVTLAAGTQTIRVQSASSALWNINWMDFTLTSTTPSPSPAPAGNATRVEAENYSSMNGVVTENTLDAGGGKDVGWIDNGDWMDYTVNVPAAGTYAVNLRIATPNTGAQLQLKKADGTLLTTVNLSNTWGFQSWQTVTATVTLAAGTQTIRVQSTSSAGWNINWMDFTLTSTTPSPAPAGSTTRVEAENYTSMNGVVTENTQDAGGGKDVGWIDNGDWMDYTVNVPAAGTYAVNLRIATPNTGAQLQLKKADGTLLTTVNLSNTWGFQSWQTVTATVTLAAGTQTIRVQSIASAGWNINWMDFTQTSTTPSPSPVGSTTKIEAENYTSMNGVLTENTQDVGGGKDVGWIDNGDWMDYSYAAPVAGTYTINLRVATIYNGAQFQIKKADGTLLTTVTVPNTGGFQSWKTIAATVTLAAGTQTIRVQSTSPLGLSWNINWMDFTQGTASQSNKTASSTEVVPSTIALDVFPNPVTDRFALQVNNDLSGAMIVKVVNLQGALQKQFSLSKATAGSSQFYLSIGELPAGTYIISVTMNNRTDSKRIIKQ